MCRFVRCRGRYRCCAVDDGAALAADVVRQVPPGPRRGSLRWLWRWRVGGRSVMRQGSRNGGGEQRSPAVAGPACTQKSHSIRLSWRNGSPFRFSPMFIQTSESVLLYGAATKITTSRCSLKGLARALGPIPVAGENRTGYQRSAFKRWSTRTGTAAPPAPRSSKSRPSSHQQGPPCASSGATGAPAPPPNRAKSSCCVITRPACSTEAKSAGPGAGELRPAGEGEGRR